MNENQPENAGLREKTSFRPAFSGGKGRLRAYRMAGGAPGLGGEVIMQAMHINPLRVRRL
jgi:hypothetical protein